MLLLFVFLVLVPAMTLSIAYLLSLMAKIYIARPRFICNTNDDRSVICARVDYERSPHTYTTRTGKTLKLVPESVTILHELDFTDRYKEMEALGQISLFTTTIERAYPYNIGRPVDEWHVGDYYYSQKPEKEPTLLVPYSSSYPASHAEQESLLNGPRGGRVERSEWGHYLEQRAETDRSYRWAKRYIERYLLLFGWRVAVCIVSIVSLVILGLTKYTAEAKYRGETQLAHITITNPATGEAIPNQTIKRKDELEQPMYEDSSSDSYILKGTVNSVTPIGGDMAVVCLNRANREERLECGMAPADKQYRQGQELFIRFGHTKDWSTGHERNHTPHRWIISSAEAKSLLATGRFNLSK